MNQSGELAAPAIYDGVLYAINGSWTFAIDLRTGRQNLAHAGGSGRRVAAAQQLQPRRACALRGAALPGDGRQPRPRPRHGDRRGAVEPKVRRRGRGVLRDGRAYRGQRRAHLRDVRRRVHDARLPRRLGSRHRREAVAPVHDPRSRRARPRDVARPTATPWMYGGAPTWRSGSYDPELDLVYWGTGNAEPYDPAPRGALDSLYASTVLAIRPKTGEIHLLLPVHPQRRVRRGRHRRERAGRHRDRRRDAEGDDPGQQERLPVHPRPHGLLADRRASLRPRSTGPPTSTRRPAGPC